MPRRKPAALHDDVEIPTLSDQAAKAFEELRAAGRYVVEEAQTAPLRAAIDALRERQLGPLEDAFRPLIEQNDRRYLDLIGSAAGTATSAYSVAALPYVPPPGPGPSAIALQALNTEVSRVATIVGDMATTVGSMAVIAHDAQEGLVRLEGALAAGQKSADRASMIVVVLTVVIALLTAALVFLTLVLVLRPAA